MKFLSFLFVASLCAIAIATSCGSDGGQSKDVSLQSEEVLDQNTPVPDAATSTAPSADPAKPAEPAQNAAGVWHHTCPKGCAGGSGTAGAPCAKCGTALVHNQAYHGAPAPPTTIPAAGAPAGPTGQAPITMPSPTKKDEPPQNAAGVWHYTCASGCAGGAGAAAPCAKCGKTLEHNKAYHPPK